MTCVKASAGRELMDGPPVGLPFLSHLAAEVGCRIATIIYSHASNVATPELQSRRMAQG
jgi:hypothetical protein